MNSIYYLSYASVLFEMANQQKKLREYTQNAQTLFNTFHQNKTLLTFFSNTSIPTTYRKKIFADLFNRKLETKFIHFIWAVIDFKRSRNIEKILKVFLKLAQHELGILFVKVTSAIYLSPKQKKEINLAVRKYFHNKQVYIHNIVDPTIIGGVKIESGAISIDGSIKNKMKLMKEETYKTIHSDEVSGGEYGI